MSWGKMLKNPCFHLVKTSFFTCFLTRRFELNLMFHFHFLNSRKWIFTMDSSLGHSMTVRLHYCSLCYCIYNTDDVSKIRHSENNSFGLEHASLTCFFGCEQTGHVLDDQSLNCAVDHQLLGQHFWACLSMTGLNIIIGDDESLIGVV